MDIIIKALTIEANKVKKQIDKHNYWMFEAPHPYIKEVECLKDFQTIIKNNSLKGSAYKIELEKINKRIAQIDKDKKMYKRYENKTDQLVKLESDLEKLNNEILLRRIR